MNYWNALAILAVLLTAVQLFPQVYQSIKTKKVRDLSLAFSIIVSTGCLVWLVYGVYIKDFAVIIANLMNFFGAIILTILKVKYKD